MRRVLTMIWLGVLLIVIGMGYVRLAPSVAERWHLPPKVTSDEDLPGGVRRQIEAAPDVLGQLDAIIRATPRTTVLAGSVEEGMITYVTRSRLMGFPDYTTVQHAADRLNVEARLRFGYSDLGVNKRRVDQWLLRLQQVRAPREG